MDIRTNGNSQHGKGKYFEQQNSYKSFILSELKSPLMFDKISNRTFVHYTLG